MNKKRVIVRFRTTRMERIYQKLKKDSIIKKRIEKAIEGIKKNPIDYGEPISRKKIPNEYLREGFDSVFWVSLSNDWRLIYSLIGANEVEIIAVVLFYGNHKDYERRFKY